MGAGVCFVAVKWSGYKVCGVELGRLTVYVGTGVRFGAVKWVGYKVCGVDLGRLAGCVGESVRFGVAEWSYVGLDIEFVGLNRGDWQVVWVKVCVSALRSGVMWGWI